MDFGEFCECTNVHSALSISRGTLFQPTVSDPGRVSGSTPTFGSPNSGANFRAASPLARTGVRSGQISVLFDAPAPFELHAPIRYTPYEMHVYDVYTQ
jgi:hypothetical protein